MSDKDLYKKIARGIYNPMDHLSNESRAFLNRMLVVDPSKRATASELLNDHWLKENNSHYNNQSEAAFLSTNESSQLTNEGWRQYER